MIKVETNCSSKMTDEEMRRVQGMGIEYLAANFVGEDACYDGIVRFQERAARYGLKISRMPSAAEVPFYPSGQAGPG